MDGFWDQFIYYTTTVWDYARHVVDIVIVAYIFYWIYRFFTDTRAVQLIKGLLIIGIVAIVAGLLRLDALDWLVKNLTASLVITVIILFQPELRRLITQFGKRNWLASEEAADVFPLDELVNALFSMSDEKVGALVVIERNSGLKGFVESGVAVDSVISEELIRTIFYPLTPLHDGAIIIQQGRIAAAACYLPLSDSKQLKKQHGARHRAALGIAEETDALVLIVSEETGGISLMVNGKMYSKINATDLKNTILFYMNPKTAYEERDEEV